MISPFIFHCFFFLAFDFSADFFLRFQFGLYTILLVIMVSLPASLLYAHHIRLTGQETTPSFYIYKRTSISSSRIHLFIIISMKKRGRDEYKKGLWTVEEDRILVEYIQVHGKGKWNKIPLATGLKRCGKSCRLRWVNYLSPHVKRGDFSQDEEDLIIRLHNLLGNRYSFSKDKMPPSTARLLKHRILRWSLIAGRVPGRTDNQVKNHWNTHLSKKLSPNRPSTRRPNAAPMDIGLCPESSCEKTTAEEAASGKSARPPSPQDTFVAENSRLSSAWFFAEELNLICPSKAGRSSGELTLDFIMYGT